MIKKIKSFYLKWLTKQFLNAASINFNLWEAAVKKWYRTIVRARAFVIDTKVINVKKGKRKYTLLIIQTANGKIRYNLGRSDSSINLPQDIEFS